VLVQAPVSLPRPRINWTPNPGPQVAFLACDCDVVLYGGRLGGGKTDALLADFLGQVHRPGYAGLFVRRSYPELLQAIRRAHKLFAAHGGRFNKSEKLWSFPSGATLRMGFVTSYEDALRYASDEYAWIGIDEATHIPADAFELLSTRLRAARHLGLKTYIRLSANPNGRHMLWVRAMFIDGKEPMKAHHDELTGITIAFIPAGLAPQLSGTAYEKRLLLLGDAEYRALALGDWYAYEGEVFTLIAGVHVWSDEQFAEHVKGQPLGRDGVPKAWTRFRLLDWGYARPYAVVWVAVDFEERAWAYHELYGVAYDDRGNVRADVGSQEPPTQVAQAIAAYEESMGEPIAGAWAGDDLWHKGRGDRGDTREMREFFEDERVFHEKFEAKRGTRLAGKTALHQRLYYTDKQQPGIIFLGQRVPHGVRTLPTLTYSKTEPELVCKKGEDHWFDAIKAFCIKHAWAPVVDRRTPAQKFRERHRNAQGGRSAWAS
jgi:hypothetical protein